MTTLLANTWFVAIAVALCVFVITYLNIDRVLNFMQKRSVGSQDAVVGGLEKMLVDFNPKQVRLTLNLTGYGLGAIFFLLLWPNIVPGLIIGFSAMLVGWAVPKTYIQNLWERRCNRIVDQMVDGLTIMANGIKAGQSITQAMEKVVENMKGPFPQEMSLILNKVRLGMSLEDAIAEFGDRIPRPDAQMLASAIIVLKETGGNLAETFATIVTTIRERQKIEKKIEALTSQGTMQAIIVSAVPAVLIVMFFVLDPNYIMPLFTKPLGWFFLALMLGLQTIGLVAMKRIVTIKV